MSAGANAPQEPTGAITSDSLAAESLRSGGEFSQNTNAAEMSVKGSNSTFTTTDTSGATTLDAAPDAPTREQQALDSSASSNTRGVSGPKYPPGVEDVEFSGRHTAEGYTGGPSADTTAATRTGYNTSVSPGQGETAPNYTATVAGTLRSEGELQPKGDNLTEGGVQPAKTFAGNVGGPQDPGRLAEQSFEGMGSANLNAAGGLKYSGQSSGGQYDVLESEGAP